MICCWRAQQLYCRRTICGWILALLLLLFLLHFRFGRLVNFKEPESGDRSIAVAVVEFESFAQFSISTVEHHHQSRCTRSIENGKYHNCVKRSMRMAWNQSDRLKYDFLSGEISCIVSTVDCNNRICFFFRRK